MLSNDKSSDKVLIPDEFKRKLWGIEFNSPLFNAAGMFKKGEAYYTVASQGAGAYLSGTTTSKIRTGNKKNGFVHPVAPYIKSGIASNWMGLPNEGHAIVAERLSRLEKQKECPIGASISADPSQSGLEAMNGVLEGLKLFTKANVDFIELNESCPNVDHEHSEEYIDGIDKSLVERLEYISKNYIIKHGTGIPLIVKFSNDTNHDQVTSLINLLLTLRFSGVNFGNTSTKYEYHKDFIDKSESKTFDYFITNFGGGISGTSLKSSSYSLASQAVKYAKVLNPTHEFHVIRTGGIESADDVAASEKSGIALNQWFTAYWEKFALHGHKLYENLFEQFDV